MLRNVVVFIFYMVNITKLIYIATYVNCIFTIAYYTCPFEDTLLLFFIFCLSVLVSSRGINIVNWFPFVFCCCCMLVYYFIIFFECLIFVWFDRLIYLLYYGVYLSFYWIRLDMHLMLFWYWYVVYGKVFSIIFDIIPADLLFEELYEFVLLL